MKKDYTLADKLDKMVIENVFRTDTTHSIFPIGLFEYGNMMANECEEALADNEFIPKLNTFKFDIVVVNRFPLSSCFYLIPYVLKVPYVSIGSHCEP